MKILYITLEDLSIHKGPTVHVNEIVAGLRKRGHQVGLIARSSARYGRGDDFHSLRHGGVFWGKSVVLKTISYLLSSVLLFLYLMRLLPHYDILYARDFPAAIIALLPRLVFKRKLVLEMNGIAHEEQRLRSESILSRMFSVGIQKAEKMAPKYSNRIVSVTTQIASYLIGNFHCQPEKIKVITNGVNTEEFRPILDVNLLGNLRSRLGIDREERVVAFVGNLAPWQGVEYLIGAAPMLLKKNQGTRFLIVGGGPLKDALMAETNRLAISNHFVFTGMVDHEEIPLYINLADICVLPKRRLKSGYSPIKLYEYMACGKPVVASRVEGLIFLEEEGAGRLVEPENVDDLEKALDDLLQDPGKRASMGSTGLKIAVERYSWKSKAIEIEGVLRDLM